jgi:pimeloyl-ACP methyl ester carboxylesterase
MSTAAKTQDGLAYEDGVLTLSDGRELAWRWLGAEGATPILRLQGTPGSRLFRHPDPRIQEGLGVRYLLADRPGFGGSTRLPGRGIAQHADDLAELLDAHSLGRVALMGTSGGGPHVLALAAKHPGRITAATVVVGASPLVPKEAEQQVGVNKEGYAAAEKGWQPLFDLLAQVRERLLSEEGMAGVLNDAPEADRKIMADPAWQALARANFTEALRQGAEGWADESLAFHRDYDFEPEAIKARVTWWHGDDDKNALLSAARRMAARVPHCDLRVWHGEGHFASLTHEKEIVEELLSRS